MRNQTATYQQYTMNQLVLPMDFSDLIPENHLARVVNDMVESLDDQLFDEVYKGGGLPLPKTLIADAGYGSESNDVAMADEPFETLISSHTFRREQKRSFSKKHFHPYNWRYDETDDVYWYPNQRKVSFKRYTKRTDMYGYTRDFKGYECESCEGCPFKPECTKARGNRQVHYNPVYEELKAKQHQKRKSEEGRTLDQKRKTDVESVFGHVKQNLGFRRLHLRGKENVHIELGLVALAHNLRKRATVDRARRNQREHINTKIGRTASNGSPDFMF